MSSIEYKDRVRQALQAMPQMTADEFYSQMSRSMATPLKYIKMTNYPTTIGFRSKTEAIEQLCLKVFGATPVYGTDVEDFKAEASEEMTKLEVELNEVREQPAVSDPISIYAKYLECEIKDMKKELVTQRELAERLEEENANTYLRRWAKAQDRAINAERELDKERALADRLAEGLRELCNTLMTDKPRDITNLLNKAERSIADWAIVFVQRDRDQYGGQLIDSDCDCTDCEYLGPIDENLTAWKEASSE